MELLKNLSKTKIALIASAAVAVLIVIGTLVISMSKPTMVPLYGELSQEDTSLVIGKLQAMGKQYSTDKNGKTILVPISDVLPVRMQLAQEGIPNSSKILGYEVFDKSESIMGNSQFVNSIHELRALEGELVRTINSMSEIEQSRVHIVVPKSDYFSKTGPESSASVFIKIKNGRKLSEAQVNGIANLVAAAVHGLSVERVAIVDQNGKPLKTPGEENDASSKNITEYKTNLENKLKKSVEDLVSKYVGLGKVQANVVAEIDFDKIVINKEEFDPDSQVARSQRSSREKNTDTEMDKNVSVGTNIPNFLQKRDPSSLKEYNKNDEIINYEISKTVTSKVLQWGAIKQLSVAVLVDGVYDKDKATKKEVYVRDRTSEELGKIKQLVSAAIGIDESRGDRVEVMNLQFASNDIFDLPSEPGVQKYDSATLAQLIIVLIVILIAAMMFLKPNLRKIFSKNSNMSSNEIPQNLQDRLISASEEQKNENNSSIHKPFAEKQYEELLNYLNSAAADNIDDTVKVLRNWISQNK